MMLPLPSPVAICCREYTAFARAHRWAIREGRTSMLLARQDWRELRRLRHDCKGITVISDDANCADLASFDVLPVDTVADPGLSLHGPWPTPLAVVLTSGSTGKPKAIAKLNQAIFGEVACLASVLHGATGARFVCTVPLEHMFGYTFGFWLPILLGASIHERRVIVPQDLKAVCAAGEGPLWIITTPAHLRAYVAVAPAYPNVAGIVSATGPLSTELARRAATSFGLPITEIYGSTETGAVAYRLRCAGESQPPDWTVLPGITLQQRGSGASVCSASHLPGPLQLGDVIQITESGFRLQGRNGDLVKVAGKRHSLAALCSLLSQLDGVRDSTFFQPNPDSETRPENTRLTAFVVLDPGYSTQDIIQQLRGKIDDVFLPRPIFEVPALPRLGTGKLRYADLEKLLDECLAQLGSASGKGNRSWKKC